MKLTLITLAMVVGAANASAATLAFNGYSAGMTKENAKSIGVVACRNGTGLPETSDSIYCDIPTERRRLGSLTAAKATLEFRAPRHNTVHEIRLTFNAPVEAVYSAMVATYGKSVDDEDYFYWERGPETGKLYKSLRGNAYVTFSFDLATEKWRQKAAEAEAKKKNTFKAF